MRPKASNDMGEDDLFRSRLDSIINMKAPLVQLAERLDRADLTGRVLMKFMEAIMQKPGDPVCQHG